MRFNVTPADRNRLMSERHTDTGINLPTSLSVNCADQLDDAAEVFESRQVTKKRQYGRMRCRESPFKG